MVVDGVVLKGPIFDQAILVAVTHDGNINQTTLPFVAVTSKTGGN